MGSGGDPSVTSSGKLRCWRGWFVLGSHRSKRAPEPQTSFACNFLNFKEDMRPCDVHIFFPKVYTRIMGIMCIYHSGSRQENRNFDKSFKLIQGIGYTGNREARTPRRNGEGATTPSGAQGTQGRGGLWRPRAEAIPGLLVPWRRRPRGSCGRRGRRWSISAAGDATGSREQAR